MDFNKNGIVISVSDQVIEQLVLERLGDQAPKPQIATVAPGSLPRVGAEITEYGGVFAGVARGIAGACDHLLIVGPEAPETMPWQKAIDWAANVEQLGFSDFTLPTRKEQALLFANVADLFKTEWYWSSEQHAGVSSHAWSQNFDYGNQDYWHKDSDDRVRAVRRIPLSNSVL